MTVFQQFLVIATSIGLLVITIELIRRRKLWEEYALLWLLTGVVLLMLGLFPGVIYSVSGLLGLNHLTTMLLIAFLFLLSIVLHFTAVISRQTERETKLAQELAILASRLDQLERKKDGKEKDGAGDVDILKNGDAAIVPKITINSIPHSRDDKSLDVETIREETL